jgi:hypothetical protein
MLHSELIKRYQGIFRYSAQDVDVWFPNGKDSIRVRLKKNREEQIFTYKDEKTWQLETVTNFLKNIRRSAR